MDISAAIKTDMNDSKGAVLHAFSENLQPPMLASINDYTVTVLLSNFFNSGTYGTELEIRAPFARTISSSNSVDPNDSVPPLMGFITSSYIDPSHSDSVSLACFSEAAVRNRLVKACEDLGNRAGDSNIVAPLINAAKTMPMDQLDTFLSEAMTELGGGREKIIITFHKQPSLTITRLDSDDFDALSEYFDSPFVDGFDLIKERVTRQESYLNGIGYAPAVYTDNGGDGSNDTIVFLAEYGVSEEYIGLA